MLGEQGAKLVRARPDGLAIALQGRIVTMLEEESTKRHVILAGRHMEWCLPVGALDVHLGPVRQQEFRQLRIPARHAHCKGVPPP